MAKLVRPSIVYRSSYLEALEEYRFEGGDAGPSPSLLRVPQLFERYVADILAGADHARPRPRGHVPYTMLWWVEGVVYLGRLSVRHELTSELEAVGGHVSYDVRPSARRQGHGTAMLAAALPVGAELGIAELLVTCEPTNVASRKVIEANGGVPAGSQPYDSLPGAHLRFLVPSAPCRKREDLERS